MKRMANWCLSGLMICALFAGTVQAQSENGGSARVSDQAGTLPPVAEDTILAADGGSFFDLTPVDRFFVPRGYIDSRAGVLYGYDQAYTSAGAFFPYLIDENSILFADARGLATYDGRGGANLGVGWRHYMPQYDRLLGLGLWYDFDGGHLRTYNQVGLSFESLGRYFDFRANGYIPVGNDQNLISTSLLGPGVFAGNQLLLTRLNERETAFTGFNTEIGGPMPLLGRYGMSGYAGFYFFTGSSHADYTGVSGRLAWQINENTQIGVQVTDDHTFGTNTQMQVSLYLPDGKASRWLRPLSVRDRLMESMVRNYRVSVLHDVQQVAEAAINPKDGNPYFIVHVDPDAAAAGVDAGDGTVENPYSRLSQFDNLAAATKAGVDIIYVSPRADGTSTNLDQGVTLLTGQRLWSSSVPHTFEVTQLPGQTFALQGYVFGQALPVLSNSSGGNVVTLADGANCIEIAGFTINGSATGSGIVGNNNSLVMINHNVIQNGLNGILLTNLSGVATNEMETTIENNIIRSNAADGIFIGNAGAAPLDLIIRNNPPVNLDLNGDGTADDADGDGVPDGLDGDNLAANDGISGNGDDGIDINADAGSVINLTIDQNVFFANGDNGMELDAIAASTLRGTITDNTIVGNGGNGIQVTASASTIDFFNLAAGIQGEIRGNVVSANGEDGIRFTGSANSQISAGIFGNVIGATTTGLSANLGIGLNVAMDSGNSLFVVGDNNTADQNLFLGNETGGINFDLSGSSVNAVDIEGNFLVGAPGGGVGLLFFVEGQTLVSPFSITNTSTSAVDLTQFIFDLSPIGFNFNTTNAPNQILAFTAFQPLPNGGVGPQSDVINGLLTVNGQAITQGTNPLQDAGGMVLVGGGVANFSQVLDLTFNQFHPGQTFTWNIDIDETIGGDEAVFGDELAGARVQATYSNGTTILGSLVLVPNNPFGASTFVATQTVGGSGGDGIRIRTSDTALLQPSIIAHNTATGFGGAAINVEAAGLSNVPNLVVNQNTLQSNSTGLQLVRENLATMNALVTANNITGSLNNGISILASGGILGGLNVNSSDNVVTGSTGDGLNLLASGAARVDVVSARDNFSDNEGDGMQAIATDNAIVNMTLQNVLSTGNTANGFNGTVNANGVFNLNISSPVDPLFSGTSSSFSGNGADGLVFNAAGVGLGTVTVDNTLFNDNTIDGVAFNREAASLILATLTNSTVTGNDDDGIQFYTAGGDPNDPNQPLSPQPNRLILANMTVDGNGVIGAANGGNGLETATFGDSVLVVNAQLSSFSGNATDGVRSFVGANSSFGNKFTGERSTFNGVNISDNGRDGIKVFAQGVFISQPTALVEVNSNAGNTLFENNGDDGIEGAVPYGTLDIRVTGDTQGPVNFNTQIRLNGGAGIEFNVADAAADGDDTGDINDPTPQQQLTDLQFATDDGDADGAANEIANFFFPTGYNMSPSGQFSATGTLTVDNVVVGDANLNDLTDQGNTGDGILVYASQNSNYSDRFILGSVGAVQVQTVIGTSQVNLTVNNSAITGNDGNGLTIIGDGLDDRDGAGFAPGDSAGNVINATVTNNYIAANTGDGVHIDLNGAHGFTQRFFVLQRLQSNSFIFDNNVIERNGLNGFFYQSNAGVMSRIGTNGSINTHIRVDFFDPQPTNPPFPYNPINVNAAADPYFQSGFNSPDAFVDNYLNIATSLNSNLVFTNNVVQFNGGTVPGVGDGVFIRVGTNTYLAADIGGAENSGNGNTFSGNSFADVRFESFIAFDPNTGNFSQPPQSIPANPGPDIIFLDDTAQMDLRFHNNTGNEVSALFTFFPGQAAVYSVSDIVGGKGAGPRPVQVFQVDDGFNLNATNNWNAQVLPNIFSGGNYHLRNVSDPLFPNTAFPVNFTTNPGNPFLP